MATDFLHELRWRGLLHEATPGVGDLLAAGPVIGYIGFGAMVGSMIHILLILAIVGILFRLFSRGKSTL